MNFVSGIALTQYNHTSLSEGYLTKIVASKVHQEEENQKQNSWAIMRWANITNMNFPFKKRINTELFIDSNKGLYIQKGDKKTDL